VPTAAPVPEPSVEEDLSEEEFAKQLQAGMADLLGQLDSSVSSSPLLHASPLHLLTISSPTCRRSLRTCSRK
jgi:hypothetical protein